MGLFEELESMQESTDNVNPPENAAASNGNGNGKAPPATAPASDAGLFADETPAAVAPPAASKPIPEAAPEDVTEAPGSTSTLSSEITSAKLDDMGKPELVDLCKALGLSATSRMGRQTLADMILADVKAKAEAAAKKAEAEALAKAEEVAPPATAPTTPRAPVASGTASAGLIVLVDCLFQKSVAGANIVQLTDWVSPLCAHVAKENRVAHWSLAEFGKGAGELAAKFERWALQTKPEGVVYVSSDTAEGRALLPTLERMAVMVIRGVK